jgi:hypothetical protein
MFGRSEDQMASSLKFKTDHWSAQRHVVRNKWFTESKTVTVM